MSTEPRQTDEHPELSRRLRGLYAPRVEVPESVDRGILDAAKRELSPPAGNTVPGDPIAIGRSHRSRWSSASVRMWASAAAVIALLITATLATILPEVEAEHEAVIDNKQPFILQALARARVPNNAAAPADADRLATMAVKVHPAEWHDQGGGPAVLLDDNGHAIAPAPGNAPPIAAPGKPADPNIAGNKADLSHFTAFDVTIDPRGNSLAVYQLRIKLARGAMKVVGVESGDGVFAAKPPYYDRKALDKPDAEEIVIAMFVTADNARLPVGKTRVATIHLMTRDEDVPAFKSKLETVAGPDGIPFAADLTIRQTPPALPGDRS